MNTIWKPCFSPFTKLPRRRGASLLETMISAAIVAIIMTCIYALMNAGVRYLHSTNTAIEMQQQSLLAMVWMSHDLGESNPRSVYVFPSPNSGILMGSPRDDGEQIWVDVSGAVRWPRFVCYYLDTVGDVPCLMRKAQYMDDPDLHTDPPPLLPPAPQIWQDYDYYRILEVPGRSVGHNVESVVFSGTNPVEVVLTVGKQEWGRTYRMTVQSKITMRN